MPYAPKPFSQINEEKKNQQAGVNISGAQTANFSTGIPGQESSNGAKPAKSSGNYANIQSYLEANKSQADQMGQNIANNIDQSAQTAQQKISSLDQKAPTVQAYDPNEIFNNVTNLNEDQKNQYRAQRTTGGYTGPQSLDQVEGYADTQKATTEANTNLKNAASEFGQQQLLKDTYARPQYSAGENKLDQVLLQNSTGSKQALENVKSKYSDLEDLFSNSANKVGESINKSNAQALANKKNLLEAEQSQFNNLINPIQQRADQANKENPLLVSRIQDDIAGERLDQNQILNDETLKFLGLSSGQNLYDINIGNYLKPNLSQVGLDNVASSDERAKYKALADLIGDQSRTQLTKDGASIDPLIFNKTAYERDYLAQQQAYKGWAEEQAQNQVTAQNALNEFMRLAAGYSSENVRRTVENSARETVAKSLARMKNETDMKFKIDSNKNNLNRTIQKG